MSRALDDAHRALAAREQPFDHRTRGDGTVACRECGDSQWVVVPSDGPLVVRPCRCAEALYDRWSRGFPRVEGRHYGEDEFVPRSAGRAEPEQETF